MSNKYLVWVSVAMIAVAVLGLATFYSMRGGLPPAVDWEWPDRDAQGEPRDEAEQRRVLLEYRAAASSTARFLAGHEATHRLEGAEPPARGELEYHIKSDTRQFFERARLHATVVIVLCYVLLGCGLLGLARLRVRGLVVVGGGVMVLALLGGGALLLFTGASTLAGIMVAVMLIAFFGQLVASNLMVNANHPFVVAAESELRALPPARRRALILKRMIGGIALTLFGGAMTALSFAIHAGVVVVATGAIAGGLMMMVMPLLAVVRMRILAPRR